MPQFVFDEFSLGVLIVGGLFLVALILFGIWQQKREKKQNSNTIHEKTAPAEVEYTPVEMRATVVDQICCVKMIGTHTPKTIKEFTIVFQTQNNELLKLNVPEELYEGFEQGQTGILSVVDGELYSFAPEEIS